MQNIHTVVATMLYREYGGEGSLTTDNPEYDRYMDTAFAVVDGVRDTVLERAAACALDELLPDTPATDEDVRHVNNVATDLWKLFVTGASQGS